MQRHTPMTTLSDRDSGGTVGSDGRAPAGVVIPAAGLGRRLGGHKKALLELAGRPLLAHALAPFLGHPAVGPIVVVLPASEAADPPAWMSPLLSRIRTVAGGRTRLESVAAGLAALDDQVEVVLVHDAARPFATVEIIDRCLTVARRGEGAVAAWPSVDTLKRVDQRMQVNATPDRSRYWRAQTPQAFPRDALERAYRRGIEEGWEATDDSELFRRNGGVVRVVRGGAWNLKITHPDDLRLAELLATASNPGAPTDE